MRGSIRKVEISEDEHKWEVRGEDFTDKGERKQFKRRFDRKKDAEDFLTQKQHKYRKRRSGEPYAEPSDEPFNKHLDEWFNQHKQSIANTTSTRYKSLMDVHIKPELGESPLKELDARMLDNFYQEKLESGNTQTEGGLSKSSVHQIHVIIHSALKKAKNHRKIKHNPAEIASPPSPDSEKQMNYLNLEESLKLIKVSNQESGYPLLYEFAILTGLRRGEILGLRWEDVDFEKNKASIRQTYVQLSDGTMEYEDPKTSSGQRVVSLPEQSIKRLKQHRTQQKKREMAFQSAWPDNDLIFRTKNGKPIDPSNLIRDFKKVLEKADLDDIAFHDLRHTHATLMLKQGEHPKVVQERLGHKSISITLDTYSHVLPDLQEDAAQRLGDNIYGSLSLTG